MKNKIFAYLVGILVTFSVLIGCLTDKTVQYSLHQATIERIVTHQYLINDRWHTVYECWWLTDDKYQFTTFESDTAFFWVGKTQSAYIRR